MEYKKAIYAGTFDPFTNGHLYVVLKSLNVFDELTILIAESPNKKPFFSQRQRIEMLKELFKGEKKVKVEDWNGLVVDFAKKNKIGSIIRGLRPTGDFEIEYQMAMMNSKLSPEVQTVFFMTGSEVNYISSSLVREIHGHGGDVSPFLPKEILKFFNKIKRSK